MLLYVSDRVVFEQFRPAPELRDKVAFLWRFRALADVTELVLPDFESELIAAPGRLFVRGPQRRLGRIVVPGGVTFHGARLHAGVASSDLLDSRVAVVGSFVECLRTLPRKGFAARALEQASCAGSLSQLARRLGCSDRHLRREIKTATGLSAKRCAQIRRFRAAFELVFEGSRPLVQIASEAGYADQAHMTHEFAAMGSDSPAALRRRMSGFDKSRSELKKHPL
jgi:AraC-like DNA-binding protein